MKIGDIFTVDNNNKRWVIVEIHDEEVIAREISSTGYIEKSKQTVRFPTNDVRCSSHNVFYDRPFADRIRKVKDLFGFKSIKDFSNKVNTPSQYFKSLDYLSLRMPTEQDLLVLKNISDRLLIPYELLKQGLDKPYYAPSPQEESPVPPDNTFIPIQNEEPFASMESEYKRRLRDIERLIEELNNEKSFIMKMIGIDEHKNERRRASSLSTSKQRHQLIIDLLKSHSPMSLKEIKRKVELEGFSMGSNLSLTMNEVMKVDRNVIRVGRGQYSYKD